MSLDESIGKIEVDPKQEASVVEVFQDVLDKLSDVGKKDKLLKFFKLVQDRKFPLRVSWLMGILNLVYCYLFLFVSLAVIQAIYIEMFFL
jgi:hypothetical protein